MLEICKNLFDAWNSANIRYCHWKSNEHLLDGLIGKTDLDVYVCFDDKQSAESLLETCGYIKFKPQKGARYPFVDEWLGFDTKTGNLIHIHLHYKIITGTKYNKEYVFPLDELIISSRVFDDAYSVYVTAPALELIILYSRIVLKAKDKKNIRINEDYKREIDFLKDRVNLQDVKLYCDMLLGKSSSVVFDAICKDSLSVKELKELYIAIRCWLKPYKKFNSVTVGVRYRYFKTRNLKNAILQKYFKCRCINMKTLEHKGVAICFLGADGSGKSTASIDICKWLNWKIEASRFYLGSGDHYNSFLKKILSKASSANSRSKSTLPNKEPSECKGVSVKRKPQTSSFKKILKRGYDTLQSIYLKKIAVRSYKEIKKAQKYVSEGAIAIFDRFPQNQFPGIYDGPKIAHRWNDSKNIIIKLQKKAEERAILRAQEYQPDVVFKLLLPPEESVRRKPDHTIEEIRPKAEITSKIVFDRSVVYEIDATQPYEAEILELKRLIWKAISGK